MMLVDSAIYMLITWYIEAVFPGEFTSYLCTEIKTVLSSVDIVTFQ